ncbi:MAG: aminopeptidase N [Gammaproteobacteria bacterium]|nr:aminopeptidase N [Gammaproteobacteria bacterium]
MRTDQSMPIERKHYQPPGWRIHSVHLHFELHPSATRVINRMELERIENQPLRLDGVELELISIAVDGKALAADDYEIGQSHLTIAALPERCELLVETRINPKANTALEGLYQSSGNFCTQCEAEGFRKITYYLDRPDVLSVFTVTIDAEKQHYPVLLSNGNLQHEEPLDSGWHRAVWHDPFPKPCYLFALVAGTLVYQHDTYTTTSGREVDLFIYVEKHNLSLCDFAMGALQRSMRWDEDVYGLEYDLDRFMIVAVDDFNMGAMENKGLNIFNSKFVLANTDTATDTDFLGVEAVIAHEYFHNWTGNRVTCRDWFQLSLKEGLTVFRDQEFSSDMHSRNVKRIEDVRLLRDRQFAEDSGPMAHPVRPDSYIEINNFYTLTVYEKGAEVIRMFHTLLGAERYRRGIDEYFKRHDGQAVTCDDFIEAMQSVSDLDLDQFKLWYSYAGTPTLVVSTDYDAERKVFTLTVEQQCPDTPGQSDKQPMHIPLKVGLIDRLGKSLPLSLADGSFTALLHVRNRTERFEFHQVASPPVPSLLREFSAPVKLQYDHSDEELAFLIRHDEDDFNRWESSMRLSERLVGRAMQSGSTVDASVYVNALGTLLENADSDPAFVAEALAIPGVETLAGQYLPMDIHPVYKARECVLRSVASAHYETLTRIVERHTADSEPEFSKQGVGRRKLVNQTLWLLSSLDRSQWLTLAELHYDRASNMTDRIGALRTLCRLPGESRDQRLAHFYDRYQDQRLVVDKWFAVQATSEHPDVLEDVVVLSKHPDFNKSNPNRLRSLIGAFAMSNPVGFHRTDGRGYELLADYIIDLDSLNPQIAARMVSPLIRYQQFAEQPRSLMLQALERISATPKLSADVAEIVQKSLN